MKKGFATSAIIYTLLLLFLVLLIGILSNTQSRKMILDELKNETKQQLEDSNETDICDIELGTSWDFVYQGKVEEWTAPCNGIYKLEVWGAQGGSYGGYTGGTGGYSYGNKNIIAGDILYIVVGGQGSYTSNGTVQGGYNGGGRASSKTGGHGYYSGSGGGATHIATKTGLLSSLSSATDRTAVLIVAGGGGGVSYEGNGSSYKFNGGTGGGATGQTVYGQGTAVGGTQSAAGTSGGFGYGGSASSGIYSGGGGGWFGGGINSHDLSPAAGGSGYIGGVTDGVTQSGKNSGNGKAKITLESYN